MIKSACMIQLFAMAWFAGALGMGPVAAQLSAGEASDGMAESVSGLPTVDGVEVVPPLETAEAIPFWRDLNRWSFQAGVGLITRSTIDDLMVGQVGLARGDAAGQVYLLQASLKLAALEPRILGGRSELDIELPVVLGLVDERVDFFSQFSAGIAARWKTFPWNRWLATNFETGFGLTYSGQVFAIQRARHMDRDRSHLEFYWPLQFTFAHPQHRQHQLVLFNHHHSGGHVFHTGGANTLGIGYRLVFGDR
jgi:hypothetical protein